MRLTFHGALSAATAGLLLLAADFAAAQAYKWKDENGKIHFSDTPPPDRKADKITIKPQVPANPEAAAKSRDWRAQLEESGVRRQQEQKQQEAAERKAKADDAKCRAAQSNLDTLKRQRPVYSIGRDGKKEYLDDKDRAAEAQEAQKRVDSYCR